MTPKLGWKICVECECEKLRTKFYCHPQSADGLMPHCKACHNGCREVNERMRIESLERQFGDPSEEEIAKRAEKIRSEWDEGTREKRLVAARVISKLSARRVS